MNTHERDTINSLLDDLTKMKFVGAHQFDANGELFVRGFVENDEHETWGISINAHGEVV
jgi:hypothetical protein